jgi:hypothetical protein
MFSRILKLRKKCVMILNFGLRIQSITCVHPECCMSQMNIIRLSVIKRWIGSLSRRNTEPRKSREKAESWQRVSAQLSVNKFFSKNLAMYSRGSGRALGVLVECISICHSRSNMGGSVKSVRDLTPITK